MAAHNDVVLHEEEDLGTAMQKLEIPFTELQRNSIDSDYGLTEIIEDSNLLLQFEDYSNNESMVDTNDLKLSNSQTIAREVSSLPRNKRGTRKRRSFKSVACLFDSEVGIKDKSCLHCGTKNTPLWREGPRGRGTLCNACGMRYRTGRLFPEYRPASSPGFKPNLHSNFHRKVIEIRRESSLPTSSFDFEGFHH